ncbi:HAD-IA family hydrolase [Aquabacter sp. L1I39]|uniref:HAD family hydrolase n=1 Tax=Aquabacter sp. L1I39 TaxID=2820278 RepID=UPI001ADB3FE1|nr:HAD-IA family hydrolase [Aquabacter sp. L1I39]QTL02032.1 HAD-IA family hydrolase [Aquabacter sp. L1I39]
MMDGANRTGAARYDAVVFDLLTALIDSWSLWNDIAGSPEAGLRWRRKYLELTYGCGSYRPYEELVAEAAQACGFPVDWAQALADRQAELTCWPEAQGVLAELARKVPLGIATNCSRTLGAIAVSRTGTDFAAVVTAEDAGYYKPRPEPYRAVLEKLGVDPARTLFVAGSASDVPGARGVGMSVYWHNRMGLKPVDAARPDYIADSLDPLLKLV